MSRLHTIGSIYSRVDGLIRKGFLKEVDRPLWLDVYKQFPPKLEPTFERVEPRVTVKEILYKEDALRAKIHKAFKGHLGVFSFQDNKILDSEVLLKSCMEYISQGISEDEAIKKLEVSLKKLN